MKVTVLAVARVVMGVGPISMLGLNTANAQVSINIESFDRASRQDLGASHVVRGLVRSTASSTASQGLWVLLFGKREDGAAIQLLPPRTARGPRDAVGVQVLAASDGGAVWDVPIDIATDNARGMRLFAIAVRRMGPDQTRQVTQLIDNELQNVQDALYVLKLMGADPVAWDGMNVTLRNRGSSSKESMTNSESFNFHVSRRSQAGDDHD